MEETREYFENKMEELELDMDYNRDRDGDYTDKLTALMYLSFIEGVVYEGKSVILEQLDVYDDSYITKEGEN